MCVCARLLMLKHLSHSVKRSIRRYETFRHYKNNAFYYIIPIVLFGTTEKKLRRIEDGILKIAGQKSD